MNSRSVLRGAGSGMVVGLAATLALPSLALASCIAPPPLPEAIRQAPAVFVGTVVDLDRGGQWATVAVTEVWTGGELPARVEVRGGQGRRNVATSADRHFKLSREYLFIPHERDGSIFRDNACSSTTRFRPGLTTFRPMSAPSPSPTPQTPDGDGGDSGLVWLGAGAALAAVAAAGLVVLRRRMKHHPRS